MSTIVEMDLSHISAIHAIEVDTFPTPWSVGMLLVELVKPESDWFVALEDGQVVGYVGVQQIVEVAHLLNLAVHPARRHRGLGHELLGRALDTARSRGLPAITLEVRESNVDAQRLYSSAGFVSVGRRRRYYTDTDEDAVLMTLLLDEPAGREAPLAEES
jgi:ribosomal-protein-alanine N-acetyltransferase